MVDVWANGIIMYVAIKLELEVTHQAILCFGFFFLGCSFHTLILKGWGITLLSICNLAS
jgi:hypothetical protein